MGAGFKTFVSGPSSSADINNYLMKQANIVCTSSTRPSAPEDGMEIFETDTRRKAIWMAAENRWQYWGPGPLGRVGSSTATADVGSGSSENDVLTCTFPAIAGRRYRVSWKLSIVDAGGACVVEGRLREDLNSGASLDTLSIHTHVATQSATNNSWVEYVPSAAGNRTVKITVKTLSNTGITVVPASTNPVRLLVEDIGIA